MLTWPGWKPSLRGWSCSGCIWTSWCWCSWSVLPQDRLRSSEILTFDNEFFSVQNAKLRIWPPWQRSCRAKLTNWWRDKVRFGELVQKSYILSHALNIRSECFWPSATMCEKEKIVTSTSWECPGVKNNEAWWEIFTTLNILMIFTMFQNEPLFPGAKHSLPKTSSLSKLTAGLRGITLQIPPITGWHVGVSDISNPIFLFLLRLMTPKCIWAMLVI